MLLAVSSGLIQLQEVFQGKPLVVHTMLLVHCNMYNYMYMYVHSENMSSFQDINVIIGTLESIHRRGVLLNGIHCTCCAYNM